MYRSLGVIGIGLLMIAFVPQVTETAKADPVTDLWNAARDAALSCLGHGGTTIPPPSSGEPAVVCGRDVDVCMNGLGCMICIVYGANYSSPSQFVSNGPLDMAAGILKGISNPAAGLVVPILLVNMDAYGEVNYGTLTIMVSGSSTLMCPNGRVLAV